MTSINTYEIALKLLELVKDKPPQTRQELISLYLEIYQKISYPDSQSGT